MVILFKVAGFMKLFKLQSISHCFSVCFSICGGFNPFQDET